ncbi:hypothetical protein nbrc107696_10930 [Gordonia spumicola]|uniref:Uncharacterized protein n=1 Tax=Gordonia spumicola TaxID=589161 RepID=A0A7I9V5W6_9ACTN|nr:hypothetical protein nbrc107696_10930 [Gordonia spumicola]
MFPMVPGASPLRASEIGKGPIDAAEYIDRNGKLFVAERAEIGDRRLDGGGDARGDRFIGGRGAPRPSCRSVVFHQNLSA